MVSMIEEMEKILILNLEGIFCNFAAHWMPLKRKQVTIPYRCGTTSF